MGELTRKAVPYTPVDRPLKDLTIAPVSSAGVHCDTDAPFHVVAVQREIEMRGVPTVLITVRPEESRVMRPLRAICPVGFTLGHSLGPPHQPELQRRVLMETLRQFAELHVPGSIVEKSLQS